MIRSLNIWLLLAVFFYCSSSSVKAEEVKLQLKNGLTVLGSLVMADGQKISGSDVVLLVHDTFAHKNLDFIKNQQKLLSEHGLNVLAITLSLGVDERTGMFACQSAHTHKHRDSVREISEWVSWLTSQGVDDITLIGHSRGGNQVVWSALENPNTHISKIVSIAPLTWHVHQETRRYHRQSGVGLLQVLNAMMAKNEGAQQEEVLSDITFLDCRDTQVSPAAFLDYYQADPRFNTPDLLQKLKMPVLVVAAEKDIVAPDLPDQMAKIKQSNVHFKTLANADHMFLDDAAQGLADMVSYFVKQ